MLSVCVRPRPLLLLPPTDGFTSEGEILEISDIQRGQAGEYECVTHNGVNSAPDSRRVLVTVNCEPPWHWARKGGGPRVPGEEGSEGGGSRGETSGPEGDGGWGRDPFVPTQLGEFADPRSSPDPPTITDVTSARTALGRAALLRCEAMAVPPADFQWYKDDRL